MKFEKPKTIKENYNLSYYTNNLEHLEKIENVKRVYLEIPPEKDLIYNYKPKQLNINYMVTFLEKGVQIAKNKDYELIWKWPDIAHEKLINGLNKVKGILNKKNINISIMSPDFNSEYGPYSLNITNSETVKSLKDYKLVTLSTELRKKDYEDIIKHIEDNSKVEILVQGNIELMKTRNRLLKKNETKSINPNNVSETTLIDLKKNKYAVKENLSNEELIILNSEEICLIEEVNYLKSINYVNFAIDGRWKDLDYLKMIDLYKLAIENNEFNYKNLKKISKNNTKGNY